MSLKELIIVNSAILFVSVGLVFTIGWLSEKRFLVAGADQIKPEQLDSASFERSPWRLIMIICAVPIPISAVLIAICTGLCADASFRRLATRHTARILGYQVTFPKEVPDGYEGGTVSLGYTNDWKDNKQGRQGRTRIAEWSISHSATSRIPDGIQFMVNESAQPGILPDEWQVPAHWRKIERTSAGVKEVAGLKFSVSRCTSEVYDVADENDAQEKSSKGLGSEEKFLPAPGAKFYALEYLAHEDGKLIGVRGYGYADESAAMLLTDSVLGTLQKIKGASAIKTQGKDSTAIGGSGSVVIYHTGDYHKFVDPYAELVKP